MNNINDEKKIKEMYESIDTPKYDISKNVLESLHEKPQRRSLNKRVLTLVAVICGLFLLIGTAGATGVFSNWQTFDFFGNSTLQDINPPSITPTPTADPLGATASNISEPYQDVSNNISSADEEYMSKFMNDEKLGMIKVVVMKSGGGMSIGDMEFDDISLLKEYLEKSDVPLPLPQYIPRGYTLNNGRINFYVDEESIIELISTEVKTDITYNIYKLADGYEKKISRIYLKYTNKDSNYIIYRVNLSHALSENSNMEIGAPESAVAKSIELAGFKKGILIHDEKKANGTLNTVALYNEITPIETINFLGKVHQEIQGLENSFNNTDVYNALFYMIKVDNLDENEVIKIADSIN